MMNKIMRKINKLDNVCIIIIINTDVFFEKYSQIKELKLFFNAPFLLFDLFCAPTK